MDINLKKWFNRPNLKDFCFLSALGIIGFVFLVVALTAFVLALGLALTWLITLAAAVLTTAGLAFAFFRFYRRLPAAFFPLLLVVLAAVFAISLAVAGSFDDASWDGQNYHQTAVLKLAKGWNPYYSYLPASPDFNPALYESYSHIWVNHYPKATWFFACNIMLVTDDIECGKAYNLLFIAASFFLCLTLFLALKRVPAWLAVVLALLAAASPVVMYQFLSFYVDGFLGSLILCLFSSAFLILLKRGRLMHWLAFVFLVVLIVNVKFSGIVFALLVAAGLFTGVIIRERRLRPVLTALVFCAAAFVVGIIGVGFHPYITNWIAKGNPLYPLYGAGAIDIISMQYPQNFRTLENPERFFLSLFSKSGGGYDNRRGNFAPSELKIPFTVAPDEIGVMYIDTRVGGFGPLMGGIILLSLVLFAVNIAIGLKHKRYRELFWSCLLVAWLLLTVFIVPEAWWARYIPHLWFLPIFFIVFSMNRKNTTVEKIVSSIPRYAILLAMAVNVVLIADNYISYNKFTNSRFEFELAVLRRQPTPPDVQITYFKDAWRHKLQKAGINYVEVADIGARKYREVIYFELSCWQVCCGLK